MKHLYIQYRPVRLFEPVLTGSILVLFSSEKILSVRFSVLKKWGENRTELNFGNTTLAAGTNARAVTLVPVAEGQS